MDISSFPHAGVAIDEQGIVTVTIRDAGSLNILDTSVISDLTQALRQVADIGAARTVVLRGTGDKAFVAGADIEEMSTLVADSARGFIDRLRQLCDAVRLCPVPVIARLPGWALGGGLELAAACDIRIASEHAHFGMPEIKVGIPSIIHAALLPRLIGQARASWLLLTGENITASTALAWGLVDEVVPADKLEAAVAHRASQFAGYGPAVVRQQKLLLRNWQEQSLESAILEGVDHFAEAFDTGEPQHYMRLFAERKRAAN